MLTTPPSTLPQKAADLTRLAPLFATDVLRAFPDMCPNTCAGPSKAALMLAFRGAGVLGASL